MKKLLFLSILLTSIFAKTSEKKIHPCDRKLFLVIEPSYSQIHSGMITSVSYTPWVRGSLKLRGPIYPSGYSFRPGWTFDPLYYFSSYDSELKPLSFFNIDLDSLVFYTPKKDFSTYRGLGLSLSYLYVPGINFIVGKEYGLLSDSSKYIELQLGVHSIVLVAAVTAKLCFGVSF